MGGARVFGLWRRVAVLMIAAAGGGLPAQALAQEPTKLDPIVVTATRIEQKASEQASSVSVVTRDDIDLRNPSVAGDVMREIPGVVVQRSGSPGNLEGIKIRGGSNRQTLVLIDGFAVNTPTIGQFDISSLPLDGFERVEVVRGAQSALYGSNAMSGVVNLVPRRGAPGMESGAGLAAGSHGSMVWNGSAGGAGDKGALRLGGGVESDGLHPNDDTHLVSFLGAGDLAVGERHRLHGILLSTDLQKGIPIDGTPGYDADHHRTRRDFLVGGRWVADVSRAFSVTASAGLFDQLFRERDMADPADLWLFEYDQTTKTRKLDFSLQGKYKAGDLSTTFVGVEYLKDRATDSETVGSAHLAASTRNRSVYVQEEIRPSRLLGISLGGRLDRNSEAGTKFSPRVAAFREIERLGTRIRAAFGKGFRVPTVIEKFNASSGNPDLAPETSASFEAGFDTRLPGDRGKFSATWFYQDFRNLIDAVSTGVPYRYRMQNVNRAFARGVESEAALRVRPGVEAHLTYTWTDTWDAMYRRWIMGIPRDRGTASVLLSPAAGWEGRVDWVVEGKQLDWPLDSLEPRMRPGFGRVDLFAARRWSPTEGVFREIALRGKIENLLDHRYEERSSYPAPGFNFLLGAEVKI